MTGRQGLALAACFVVAAAVVVGLAGGRGESRGSTLSHGAGGWLAARRYLEARGARVTLISEPLSGWVRHEQGRGDRWEPGQPGVQLERGLGVLVLAFPWTGLPTGDLDEAIDSHLGRGGDLVIAYSGEESGAERLIGWWDWYQVAKVPLAPWRWRAFLRREWQLRPAALGAPQAGSAAAGAAARTAPGAEVARTSPDAAGGARAVRVWAPRGLPRMPGARVLFTSPRGLPVVAVFRRRGGRVVMLPADALANSRLGEAGNADLLETLLLNLGPRWAFDEYHHGLVTADAAGGGLGRTADLLLAHLVLLYLLAALALARRQGPPWREPAAVGGSAASFLRGLAALHHRLGHHHEAALLLLRRARELDRGLTLPPELDSQAAAAGPEELVEIARQVARRRAGRFSPDASGEPR
jgi:hypothetical protein